MRRCTSKLQHNLLDMLAAQEKYTAYFSPVIMERNVSSKLCGPRLSITSYEKAREKSDDPIALIFESDLYCVLPPLPWEI